MKDPPLILDTSGWLLALAGAREYARALEGCVRAIVPGLVLAEVDWHLRSRRSQMRRLMRELWVCSYDYQPPSRADLDRAMEIDRKFADLELGLVDASVAALAERLEIYRVLTTDSDFAAVRVGTRWRKPLELAVPLLER
ncbi:MAG: type II toxin-antitoxin system VapC family toxin [Deltaproteobacteria bacterium]|nr:type II toxin-antitoxin system VapC family toxin [Deltaproteobacteria bacterium]